MWTTSRCWTKLLTSRDGGQNGTRTVRHNSTLSISIPYRTEKMHWLVLFPTSLSGVLVFRLDPAAPLPVPAPPLLTISSSQLHFSPSTHQSQLHFSPSTHHSPNSHHPLITAQLITAPNHSPTSRPLGRGCLSRGRRSTQSLLEQLRRAWLPLGRGCLSYHSSQLHLSHHNFSSQLITTHHTLSHTNSSQLHFSHLTHHSSTAYHNSSQLHFSQVHFSSLLTGPLLITTYHIPTHHSSTSHTSLITPHLSHHNFSSQLITTYHIPTHHSSTSHTTSHTSLITSELITAPLLTPDITSPLLTPHFSHLTSHTSPKFTLSLDT